MKRNHYITAICQYKYKRFAGLEVAAHDRKAGDKPRLDWRGKPPPLHCLRPPILII